MIRIFFVILSLVYGINCFSGTIDPNTPDKHYIEYGLKFPYVVQLMGKKTDDSPYSGSAVAYGPNIVITAAHLFHENKEAAIICNNKVIPIKKIIVHKDYNYNKFGKHDIAICLLSEDIGLDWYPEIYTDDAEVGSICSMAGFGATGTFVTGIKKQNAGKRAGSNFIDATDPFLLFCSPSLSHKKTQLEFLIAPGDSGGGLFIGNKLAGIHSGVIEDKPNKGKSKYGAVSIHTRVSVYKDWIKDTVFQLTNK
jgi:V8-like Glu-specific endopeptidase